MDDIIKTLTTASPLQETFHTALESADIDALRQALAEPLKQASRRAIENRIKFIKAERHLAGAAEDDEPPTLPAAQPAAQEPAEAPKKRRGRPPTRKATEPTQEAPQTAEPAPAVDPHVVTVEELINNTLQTLRNCLGVLANHGWTDGDMVAELSTMIPGRSQVGTIKALSDMQEGEMFPAGLLLGELIAAATKQLRLAMVPWNTMPEDKQKQVLDHVRKDCEVAAKNALRIFSAENRSNFIASLDNVQFKSNGVKVAMTIGKNAYAHLLADAAGGEVQIVLPENFDMYSGVGDAMKTTPDQPDIFGGSDGPSRTH